MSRIDPAIPLLSRYPQRIASRDSDTLVQMPIAALFKIVKRWKQSKCLLHLDWIYKTLCIHTREYYSATESEVLIDATK